jgi:hypothetical protein
MSRSTLLPWEKVVISAGRARPRFCAREAAHGPTSLSAGERGDRKAVGEGSLPYLLDHPSERIHHFVHELVGVLQHHRMGMRNKRMPSVRK